MSLWLVRAGKYGEHENRFVEDNRVYLTWGEEVANTDLGLAQGYDGLKSALQTIFPDEPTRRLGNWTGQFWAFVQGMQIGDWVVLPMKHSPTIAIGEVISQYKFDRVNDAVDYRHYREVRWLNTAVPRAAFDQDLLYSFGAFLTVCEIKRNDAERRVRAMSLNSWQAPAASSFAVASVAIPDDVDQPDAPVDLEQLARDSIANLINQKFRGHNMARLVDAILRAQGFTTFLSPEGPDGGVDILAGSGPFGFDSPRICVQVKSGDSPTDRPEFTQLIGAMQNVHADQGLFVSWSGFKNTVSREIPNQFFKVRLWNQSTLIEQLLANYDKLDQEIRAEIPLKLIWSIANLEG